MRAWGSRYARLVLQRCGENKRRACEVLGISYHTLQAYLNYRERRRPATEPQGGPQWSREPTTAASPGITLES